MLERKRLAKTYQAVPGDEDADLELGEGVGAQESGTTIAALPVPQTLDEEIDNWDENVEDAWDDDEHATGTESVEGDGPKTPSASSAGEVETESRKRKDWYDYDSMVSFGVLNVAYDENMIGDGI